MKTKYLFSATLIIFASYSLACTQPLSKENEHTVRTDFRFGSRFYSLCSNETGKSYAIRGSCSGYNQPFNVLSSDTSTFFILDSAKGFFEKLNKIRSGSLTVDHNSDAPRVEIYYDKKKIYDSHKWDEKFWSIFRPIMMQMPKGFNPFLVDDKPFG